MNILVYINTVKSTGLETMTTLAAQKNKEKYFRNSLLIITEDKEHIETVEKS